MTKPDGKALLPNALGVITLFASLAALASLYFVWTWSHELGDLGGDNAYYLLTARHFSPWSGPSDVATYFAVNNPYPPLYPLVLALFGGGESVLIAHLITTSCLLAACALLLVWMRGLGISTWLALSATMLFGLLPGVYLQALSILSENLYLALTLATLAAATRAERVSDGRWLWIAAVFIAASTLTRSAGVALVAAFGGYLLLHRPARSAGMFAVAIVPMFVWAALDFQQGSGYVAALTDKYGVDPFGAIFDFVSTQAMFLWYGWVSSFTSSPVGFPVMSIIGVLAVAALGVRAYQRKLDGLYGVAYLALVLLWPYPAEAKRLVLAILPVLLVQVLWLLARIQEIKFGRMSLKSGHGLVLIVAVVALPELVLTVNRFLQPMSPELVAFRRSQGWYELEWGDAIHNVISEKSIVDGMRNVATGVAEQECVYSIKPSLTGLYGQRRSILPPREHLDDAAFRLELKKHGCRYFLMLGFISPSFSVPYYPVTRLGSSLRVRAAASDRDNPAWVLADLSVPP